MILKYLFANREGSPRRYTIEDMLRQGCSFLCYYYGFSFSWLFLAPWREDFIDVSIREMQIIITMSICFTPVRKAIIQK